MIEYASPQPPPSAPSAPPRPRWGRAGAVIAWVVIALSTAAIVSRGRLLPAAWHPPGDPAQVVAVSDVRSVQLEISGRYAVGARELVGGLGGADSSAQLAAQIRAVAETPLDRLRATAVIAELTGAEAAL